MAEAKPGKVTRVFFTPVGSEILGTDGGQLWYGDKEGLGSVSDMSKYFVLGSLKLADSEGEEAGES